MSEQAPTTTGTAGQARGARTVFPDLRDVWAVEKWEAVVRFVQTPVGKLLLSGTFVAIAMGLSMSILPVLAAAACAFLPRYRKWIVPAAGIGALVRHPYFELEHIGTVLTQEGFPASMAPTLSAGALVVFFVFAWGLFFAAARRKDLLFVRRPVVSLLILEGAICAFALSPLAHGIPRAGAWAFLFVLTAFTWFLAYGVMDQRTRTRGPLPFQMGILHPLWGSTTTPYGKGAAFLRKHEAKTPSELAVTQIKSLKLLVWAVALTVLDRALTWIGEVHWHIPTPAQTMVAFVHGSPYAVALSWGSLAWATLHDAVALAVFGHKVIALARLAGYRLPRNTWRPLESRTLAEFWNRYYYYFKELLVEFFFFPTFLKTFRDHPRLRVFFATFMAAGVGNAIFHFIRDVGYVVSMGLRGAVESYSSYMFYCAALAVGIGVSQARMTGGRKLPTTVPGTVWSVLCVWSVVVWLRIFADETRAVSLFDRFKFMASLFGVDG